MTSESETSVPATWLEDPPRPSNALLASRDLLEGLQRSWLWSTLALRDIKLRYQGSLLGPLWVTVSYAVMVASISTIYARLFRQDVTSYMPFLMVGLVVWLFISSILTEGCVTFVNAAPIIQQVRVPLSLHVYRTVSRCVLVFAHNLVIVPPGLYLLGVPLGWSALLAIPAIGVLIFNALWVSLLLGQLGARFRDVPPIVASAAQVIFVVTPIVWSGATLPDGMGILALNPFFAAVDIVRAPLLDGEVSRYSWPIILIVTACGWATTFALFTRFRSRIPYWV